MWLSLTQMFMDSSGIDLSDQNAFMDMTSIDLFDQNMSMACAKVGLRCSWISLILIYLIKI